MFCPGRIRRPHSCIATRRDRAGERARLLFVSAKYIDADGAALLIPAKLSPQQVRRLQELAVEAFRLLGCAGLARIDFFVKGDDMFVNEVNTLPGFTSISMYPKLWEASGLSQTDLMDRLIAHAFARHARRRALSSE